MLEKALKKAKKDEVTKVPINFQAPIDLKEDFEKMCKSHKVSVTSMLISLMEVALEEFEEYHTNMLIDGDIEVMKAKARVLRNKVEQMEDAGAEDIPEYAEARLELAKLDQILTKL